MSTDDPDPCGTVDLEPKRPDNRPGLAAVGYRIGTHSAFLRRMQWRIPRQTTADPVAGAQRRPLAALTARETSDPTVALMDAWAATLDVLSFYSERIANEGYLATATERASLVELARTIGYELAPGVAASAHLAFTVEDADDPFRAVEVPAGTQAMSVPQARGALPQVYETAETILARAEWNAIPARTEEPQNIALYHNAADTADPRNGRLYLFDLDNSFDLDAIDPAQLTVIADAAELTPYHPVSDGLNLPRALAALQEDATFNVQIDPTLKAVEMTETFLRGIGLGLSPGDRMLAVGARRDDADAQVAAAGAFRVVEADADREFGMTRVVLAPIGRAPLSARLGLPPLRMAQLRIGAVTTGPVAFNSGSVEQMVTRTAWSGATFDAFLKTQQWPRLQLMQIVRQPAPVIAPALGEAAPGFYALRQTAGFFGNAAPRWETLATADNTKGSASDPYADSWDAPSDGSPPRTVWTDSQGTGHTSTDAYLEREIEEISPDQWVLLESPAGNVLPLRVGSAAGTSLADFAVNGKATGLTFRRMDGSDLEVDPTAPDLAVFRFRTARAHVVSEHLAQAGAPIREDMAAGAPELALDSLYLDLEPGRSLSISGERADAAGVTESETLAIADVLHVGGATRVVFAGGPAFSYRRATIRVNANVALATHGEAYTEAIGSGDGAAANQAFRLAKTPLTFVSAATETGIATTLTVRVDGVAWAEVPALLDARPDDPVYQVRIDDNGTTRVVFGDGVHGRRLPTGQLNVTAAYRAGIGAAGETPDETIIQLKTRPLGIRTVANPSPATGSAEPETLAIARERAPRSVRTLGRIVSLTDYADFARGFAGIGKAVAVALWVGRERIVHLTVGPEAEGVFDQASETLANLREAVASLRNPTHRVEIAPHAPRYFRLAARIVHDPRHLPEDVEAAARTMLRERFGYAARTLAQPVSAAELVAALQGIAGVVAIDLDALALYDEASAEAPAGLANILPAMPARIEGAAVLPAELLTLLAAGAELTLEAEHA